MVYSTCKDAIKEVGRHGLINCVQNLNEVTIKQLYNLALTLKAIGKLQLSEKKYIANTGELEYQRLHTLFEYAFGLKSADTKITEFIEKLLIQKYKSDPVMLKNLSKRCLTSYLKLNLNKDTELYETGGNFLCSTLHSETTNDERKEINKVLLGILKIYENKPLVGNISNPGFEVKIGSILGNNYETMIKSDNLYISSYESSLHKLNLFSYAHDDKIITKITGLSTKGKAYINDFLIITPDKVYRTDEGQLEFVIQIDSSYNKQAKFKITSVKIITDSSVENNSPNKTCKVDIFEKNVKCSVTINDRSIFDLYDEFTAVVNYETQYNDITLKGQIYFSVADVKEKQEADIDAKIIHKFIGDNLIISTKIDNFQNQSYDKSLLSYQYEINNKSYTAKTNKTITIENPKLSTYKVEVIVSHDTKVLSSDKKTINHSRGLVLGLKELEADIGIIKTSVGKDINIMPKVNKVEYDVDFSGVTESCLIKRSSSKSSAIYTVGNECSGKDINYSLYITSSNGSKQVFGIIKVKKAEEYSIAYLSKLDIPVDGSGISQGEEINKQWGYLNNGRKVIKNIRIKPVKISSLESSYIIDGGGVSWNIGERLIIKHKLNRASDDKSDNFYGSFVIEHNSDGNGYKPLKFTYNKKQAFGTYEFITKNNKVSVRYKKIIESKDRFELIITTDYPVDFNKIKIEINGVNYQPLQRNKTTYQLYHQFQKGEYSGVVQINNSTASKEINFKVVEKVIIPSTPNLSSPSNNSTIDNITPQLRWNSVSGAIYYKLLLGVVGGGSNGVVYNRTIVNSTNKITKTLIKGKEYAWSVAACNSAGCSNFSTGKRFAISKDADPEIPTPEDATKPTISSLNAYDYGSTGDGKVKVTFNVSSNSSLALVRTHCGIGSNYNYAKYIDSSNSTGAKSAILQNSSWAGQTVYCKAEVETSAGVKADIKSDSVRLSATAVSTKPTISSLNAYDYGSTGDGKVKVTFNVSSNSSLALVRTHCGIGSNYNYAKYIDSSNSTGAKSAILQNSSWAGQTVYCKAEVETSAGVKADIKSDSVRLSATAVSTKPTISSLNAYDYGSTGDGKVKVTFNVSSNSSLALVRTHCGIGSNYNYAKYIDSSNSTGAKSAILQNSSWAGQTVYCKAEVETSAGVKADIKSDSVRLSATAVSTKPTISSLNAYDYGSTGDGKVKVTFNVSSNSSLALVRTHCGIGSNYNYAKYIDSSNSTGAKSAILQNSSWAGQTVYCKAEVETSAGVKADIKSDSVRLSATAVSTKPTISSLNAYDYGSTGDGKVKVTFNVSSNSSLALVRTHCGIGSNYNSAKYIDSSNSTGAKSAILQNSSWAGQTVYCKAEVETSAGVKADIKSDSVRLSATAVSTKPTVSSLNAYDYGSTGDGKVKVTFNVSSNSSLALVRTHCGIGSNYNSAKYIDSSNSTGAKSAILQNSSWAGQTVYCKAEVETSAGVKADIKSDSVRLSATAVSTKPTVSSLNAYDYGSTGDGKVKVTFNVSSNSSLALVRTHCGIGSNYNSAKYIDSSNSTGAKSAILQNSSWAGQTVYCKAEVETSAGVKADIKSDSVRLSATAVSTKPTVSSLNAYDYGSTGDGKVKVTFNVSSNSSLALVRTHCGIGSNYNSAKYIDSSNSTGAKSAILQNSSWAGQTVYCKAEVETSAGVKADIKSDSVRLSATAVSTKPTVSSLNAYDYGSTGDGKVKVTFNVSSNSSLALVRTHCGIGSNYNSAKYIDSSNSTGAKSAILQNSSWAGQTVYCKAEVETSAGVKADIKSDSVRLI